MIPWDQVLVGLLGVVLIFTLFFFCIREEVKNRRLWRQRMEIPGLYLESWERQFQEFQEQLRWQFTDPLTLLLEEMDKENPLDEPVG